MQRLSPRLDPIDCVAFTKSDIQVTIWGDRDGAWTSKRCAGDWGSVGRWLCFARARVRRDVARVHVHATNAVIANVANQQETVAIEGDAMGLSKLDRKSTRLNSSHLGISYAV